MINAFYSEKPITDFKKLGTGRKRKKVVVMNENGRILFIAEVRRNHPCRGEVEFSNRKIFYTATQNLNGKRTYLFLWSDVLEDRWCKQSEVDTIEEWLNIASPQDIFAFLECVGFERCVITEKYTLDFLKEFAKSNIRQHLRFLSLVELRRLTALLEPAGSSERAARHACGRVI